MGLDQPLIADLEPPKQNLASHDMATCRDDMLCRKFWLGHQNLANQAYKVAAAVGD